MCKVVVWVNPVHREIYLVATGSLMSKLKSPGQIVNFSENKYTACQYWSTVHKFLHHSHASPSSPSLLRLDPPQKKSKIVADLRFDTFLVSLSTPQLLSKFLPRVLWILTNIHEPKALCYCTSVYTLSLCTVHVSWRKIIRLASLILKYVALFFKVVHQKWS